MDGRGGTRAASLAQCSTTVTVAPLLESKHFVPQPAISPKQALDGLGHRSQCARHRILIITCGFRIGLIIT